MATDAEKKKIEDAMRAAMDATAIKAHALEQRPVRRSDNLPMNDAEYAEYLRQKKLQGE